MTTDETRKKKREMYQQEIKVVDQNEDNLNADLRIEVADGRLFDQAQRHTDRAPRESSLSDLS